MTDLEKLRGLEALHRLTQTALKAVIKINTASRDDEVFDIYTQANMAREAIFK